MAGRVLPFGRSREGAVSTHRDPTSAIPVVAPWLGRDVVCVLSGTEVELRDLASGAERRLDARAFVRRRGCSLHFKIRVGPVIDFAGNHPNGRYVIECQDAAKAQELAARLRQEAGSDRPDRERRFRQSQDAATRPDLLPRL